MCYRDKLSYFRLMTMTPQTHLHHKATRFHEQALKSEEHAVSALQSFGIFNPSAVFCPRKHGEICEKNVANPKEEQERRHNSFLEMFKETVPHDKVYQKHQQIFHLLSDQKSIEM